MRDLTKNFLIIRRGFSLVELLVVIAILGILASAMIAIIAGPRRQARDDRRVADLRQVQQALQLYYLKCGMYPGSFNPVNNECLGGEVVSPLTNTPDNWNQLRDALRNAKVGVQEIPNDPSGGTYYYKVQLREPALSPNPVTPKAQCYVLMARLETEHRSLRKDLDSGDLGAKLRPFPPPAGSGCNDPTCKKLYPNTPTISTTFCNDDVSPWQYCVGNIECFYGG